MEAPSRGLLVGHWWDVSLLVASCRWSREEPVDVNDILQESPLGIRALVGTQVVVDGGIDLFSHFNFLLGGDGLGVLGEHGHNCEGGVLEHLVFY